jgi:hypothetical protein
MKTIRSAFLSASLTALPVLVAAQQPAPGTHAVDKPSCPAEGKSKLKGDSKKDDEARNLAKRFVAKSTTPVLLTIADLKALQHDTDPNAADHTHKFLPRALDNLHAGAHTLSEGDRVALTGYLHRAEEGSNSESVNCQGKDGRDIHLNLNKTKPITAFNEWTGIVLEAAPQVPLPGYTSADHKEVLHAFQAVLASDLPVLAIGSLTYDNAHQVNSDKNNPRGTNPKRISLWELHPVLKFYVCPKGDTCDPDTPNAKWQTLKDWQDANPAKKKKKKPHG